MPQPHTPREELSQPQRVDRSLLRDVHDWAVSPQQNISFKQLVEENWCRHVNMAWYRLIYQADEQMALNRFSKLSGCKKLFYIPDTLACDRTFARDVEEVYYVDAMDNFLQGTGSTDVNDLPILKRDLSQRAFSAFSRRPQYFTELYELLTYHIWTPHDAWENSCFSYPELCSVFPRPGRWIRLIKRKSGLPVPCPFACSISTPNSRKLSSMMKTIYWSAPSALVFALSTSNSFFFWRFGGWKLYTGRQHVVEKATIDILEKHYGSIPTVCGKPVQAIIEYMRSAGRCPDILHKWLIFAGNCLEYSAFIWARKGFGEFDSQRTAGRSFRCGLNQRKILNVDEERGTESKDICALDKVITGPDMAKVPGLLPVVSEEEWLQHGNIIIGDLLYNLVHLQNKTGPLHFPRLP